MARIRTIKPEFWTSEQILSVSRDARLLFIGLWNFSDDGGNHPASAITLKAQVFPADDLTVSDIRRMLDELSASNLLITYEHEGKSYWHITGWQHQKIDKPSYKYPKYSAKTKEIENNSTNARLLLDDCPPAEGKGREVDIEKKEQISATSVADVKTLLWNCCREYLGKNKMSLVGKWVKDYGEEKVFAAVLDAQKNNPAEPVSYITRILKPEIKTEAQKLSEWREQNRMTSPAGG